MTKIAHSGDNYGKKLVVPNCNYENRIKTIIITTVFAKTESLFIPDRNYDKTLIVYLGQIL